MNRLTSRWLFVMLATALIISSCAGNRTPKSAYYLLSPIPTNTPVNTSWDMSIGIERVEVPEHLQRQPIATESSVNRIEFEEYHRWAEPLVKNVTHVLQRNLSTSLSNAQVLLYPDETRAVKPDFLLLLHVQRFIKNPQNVVELTARWQIIDPAKRALIASDIATFTQPATLPTYESLVTAMSSALGELCITIAQDFSALERT